MFAGMSLGPGAEIKLLNPAEISHKNKDLGKLLELLRPEKQAGLI